MDLISNLDGETKLRIINLYRTFAPQDGESQQIKFKYQLSLMKKASDVKFIIVGDIIESSFWGVLWDLISKVNF